MRRVNQISWCRVVEMKNLLEPTLRENKESVVRACARVSFFFTIFAPSNERCPKQDPSWWVLRRWKIKDYFNDGPYPFFHGFHVKQMAVKPFIGSMLNKWRLNPSSTYRASITCLESIQEIVTQLLSLLDPAEHNNQIQNLNGQQPFDNRIRISSCGTAQ